MNKINKILVILFTLLFIFTNNIFSEDLILYIGTDEYIRQMPDNNEELKTLVRDLVKMYNDLNIEYINTQNYSKNSLEELKLSLQNMDTDMTTVIDSLSIIESNMNSQLANLKDTLKSTNNSKILGLSIGYGSFPPFDNHIIFLDSIINLNNNLYTNLGISLNIINGKNFPIVRIGIGTWIF